MMYIRWTVRRHRDSSCHPHPTTLIFEAYILNQSKLSKMKFFALSTSLLAGATAVAAAPSLRSNQVIADQPLSQRSAVTAQDLFPGEQLFARQQNAHTDQYLADVPIHSSCNATQAAQIQAGLDDMKTLAQATVDYIMRNGRDELFAQYFGADADTSPVVGIFQQVLSKNKNGMTIRCDDPDEKCYQDGWNGYWRTNVTAETNICDLSYTTRRRLTQLCGFGWTVAGSNSNLIWGADLLHRM